MTANDRAFCRIVLVFEKYYIFTAIEVPDLHIRMEAKRMATDAIVEGGVHQNVHQVPAEDSGTIAKSLN
jgi:hypothetical protein